VDIAEIWFSPCYSHPYDKNMVDPKHRLKMCELVAAREPKIKVFGYEIKYEPYCTYDFLKYLPLQWKMNKYEFSYIIGLDNANSFNRWIESEKLKNMVRFITVSRQGIRPNKKIDWYKKPPHIYLDAKDAIINMSSTQVRKWIEEGNFPKAFDNLHPAVYHYAVAKHNLY